MSHLAMLLTLAAAQGSGPFEDDSGSAGDPSPRVEIVGSWGTLDGPNVGALAAPRWDRVRLELEVQNRLPVQVGDLVLRVELVRGPASDTIPGWSFDVRLDDVWIPGGESSEISVERPLPDRREPLPAEEVRHRVRLIGYRFVPVRLGLGLELLQSGFAGDQRAAFESFDAQRLSVREVISATQQLASTLAQLPRRPQARDALRLLYALRALGRLQASDQILSVLALEDRLPPKVWGPAVVDLAGRMVDGSAPDAPRLQVLPSWARDRSGLVEVRAQDAVPEAVRDAVMQMGDPAVPGLVVALHRGPTKDIRERAWRLLVSLGRATVRSQLRLEPNSRAQMIEAFGALRLPDAAPALVDLLGSPGRMQRAAAKALRAIGPPAVPALKRALTRPDSAAAQRTLADILAASGTSASRLLGWERAPERPSEAVAELARRLRAERQAELTLAIDAALQLPFDLAIPKLDAVYREDPELYLREQARISAKYLEGARALLEAGNYDRALGAARDGLSVQGTGETAGGAELRQVAALAVLSAAEGWADLERWPTMASALQSSVLEPPPPAVAQRLEDAQVRLAVGQALEALAEGERARARAVVDRALRTHPRAAPLTRLDWKLRVLENLPVVVGLALGLGALVLAAVLVGWRAMQRARMARLEAILDQARSGEAG